MSADALGSGEGGPRRRTSVRVTIVGEEYTLRSDAPEAHARAVAEHVDRMIRQVLSSGSVVETHKAAILAAIQITDELLRLRAGDAAVADRASALAADVRRWLPPTKRSSTDAAE